MKEVSIALSLCVSIALFLAWSATPPEDIRELDEKIVRDAEGNYYRVEAGVCKPVILRKIDIEKF